MDPSVLGLPGPPVTGERALLHCTQGDHFSGWGQMERPLGRKTSPVVSSVLSAAFTPAGENTELPFPFRYEGVSWTKGSQGCRRSRTGCQGISPLTLQEWCPKLEAL